MDTSLQNFHLMSDAVVDCFTTISNDPMATRIMKLAMESVSTEMNLHVPSGYISETPTQFDHVGINQLPQVATVKIAINHLRPWMRAYPYIISLEMALKPADTLKLITAAVGHHIPDAKKDALSKKRVAETRIGILVVENYGDTKWWKKLGKKIRERADKLHVKFIPVGAPSPKYWPVRYDVIDSLRKDETKCMIPKKVGSKIDAKWIFRVDAAEGMEMSVSHMAAGLLYNPVELAKHFNEFQLVQRFPNVEKNSQVPNEVMMSNWSFLRYIKRICGIGMGDKCFYCGECRDWSVRMFRIGEGTAEPYDAGRFVNDADMINLCNPPTTMACQSCYDFVVDGGREVERKLREMNLE